MSTTRELLPIAGPRETRDALGRLVRPRVLLAFAAMVTSVLGVVIGLVGPWLLGRIVDQVIDGAEGSQITLSAAGLLMVAIGQGLFFSLGNILVARLGEAMLADLREEVVDRILHLPLAAIEAAGSGDVAARITGDVSVVAHAVRRVIPLVMVAGLNIALTVVGLAVVDWRFAIAALCAVPVQVFSLRSYLRASGPVYASQRVAESGRAQAVLDTVEGASAARVFRLRDQQKGRVETGSREAMDLNLRAVAIQTVFTARLNLAEFIGLGGILLMGFFLVDANLATIGGAAAAALYFHRLFDPIGTVLGFFDEVMEASSSLSRLVGVLDMGPPSRKETAVVSGDYDLALSMSEVRYAYIPGYPAVDGVDLDIARGENVVIVGASGAGKTTIARLFIGIQRPQEGAVTVAGRPLNVQEYDPVGREVVLVSQEVHVFAGSIAADLRLACPSASDEQIWAALSRVQADAWVRALPAGIETVVGAGGNRLTVTQSQQLALARLVLANPPIALLDEATAEAGSAGARALEASAGAALEGRTSLVIAHRLTQAMKADRIIVMDRGRIVERGSHQDLLAAGGIYARLWATWSEARAELR